MHALNEIFFKYGIIIYILIPIVKKNNITVLVLV